MDETKKLVFRVPGKTTPGYLRRTKRALEFREKVGGGDPTAEDLEQMVDFLADYVVAESREAAVEALFDASEEQFYAMLSALTGEGSAAGDPTRKAGSRGKRARS